MIGKILARRYPAFSRPELERIAEFSGGNARVAFALADRCADGGDLVQLNDTELFERLFFQTDTPNRQLLGGGEVCSLLYSFESTDLGPDSEMALLGSLADLSVLGLAREVGELKHRGLVQQRGRWKAVLPHAIANRLAARALKLYPTDFLVQKLVTEATGRVAVSFARRLGFLHETVQAKEIVSTLLHEDGQLADLPSLNDVGRSVFKNVAPVNQRETLNALLKATLSPQFIDAGNYTRSTFIEVARCLAYEPDLFDEAVLCLLRFTAGEETGRKQNSTVEVLKSLFYCHLSGTLAPPNQREKIVNRLLSGSENESRIGLSLLAAGLEAGHFTSIHSTEFGGRSRSYGWWPRTRDQYREWYTSFIAIAREHGTRSGPIRAEVRHIFADALRGLWTSGCLDEELTAAAEEWSESEAWPEGWLALRRIQRWDKERVSSESLARLVELETKLSPKDLEARIRARVMTRGSSALDIYDDDEGGSNPSNIGTRYQETQLDAEQLGELAAGDRDLLGRLAPSLLLERGSAEAFSFGRGIGRASGDPQLLLKDLRLAVRSADKTQVGLNVVRGILHAWHSHDPSAVDAFLDDALCDEVWGYFFPELQLQISLGQKDVDRLLRSLELNIAPEWQFQYLGMGRATDPLSVVQIFDLVRGIASRNSGISVAIDILGMVIHCASEKDENYALELRAGCLSFLRARLRRQFSAIAIS